MSNRNEELRDLLVKVADMRWNESLTSDDLDLIVKLLKGELKSDRQTGPAIGQKYWIDRLVSVAHLVYKADGYGQNVCRYGDLYPEEQFAEAGLRARKLIMDVNKRRREMNEGEEFRHLTYHIFLWNFSGLGAKEESNPLCARWNAYPFGLFKNSVDCKACIREFEDELEWYYKEYLPLMAELDDYDWADAPGWGGEV